jgi:RNA polymerase sigma-70 factor (ECF subfamily)
VIRQLLTESVVLAAGQQDTPQSTAALEQLCNAYWYPLYACVRRRGYQPQDAQDLTQGFFAALLARNYLARADRQRGRFRTFLLSAWSISWPTMPTIRTTARRNIRKAVSCS